VGDGVADHVNGLIQASLTGLVIEQNSFLLLWVKREVVTVAERRTTLIVEEHVDADGFTLRIVTDVDLSCRQFVEGRVRLARLQEQVRCNL